MAHTAAIIAAAREGKKFLALPLFDGTDENGVEDSFIVILDWKQPFADQVAGCFRLCPARGCTSGVLRSQAGQRSRRPTRSAMRYWENGVADDMQMDFGDFVMNAKMKEFAPQPHKC